MVKLVPSYIKASDEAAFGPSFPPANKDAVCVPARPNIFLISGALPTSVQADPLYSNVSCLTGSPPPIANPAVCVPATEI